MKKVISIVVSLALSLSFICVPVYASQNSIENGSDVKSNFNFIDTSLDNIEYTYEENNIMYRVIETMNEDRNYSHTQIYAYENNSFILKEEFETNLIKTDDVVEIIKTEDGNVTQQTVNLNEVLVSSENSINPRTSRAGWEYKSSNDGSTGFKNFTYSVVAGLIVSAITGSLSLGKVASEVISALVGIIVSEAIPTVYYSRTVSYYRNTKGQVTSVKASNKYYYDKNHRSYIGTGTQTWNGLFPW